MRNVLAIALVVLVAPFGIPAITLAEAPASVVSVVSGRAVDAAGRAVVNQRVDLVRSGEIVSVVTTNPRGEWSFPNVSDGDYLVRTSINGKIAGVRVSVVAGQPVTGALIVLPTAAVSPQFGALAGLIGSMTTAAATTVVSVAASLGITTETVALNQAAVAAIINALPPAEKVAFASAVITAVKNNPVTTFTDAPSGGNNVNTGFVQQLTGVVNSGGTATVNAS